MQESTRAFFKRGGTACAAAALVLGSTFAAAPMANAVPAESPATAVPTAPATNVPAPSDGALPGGLEEALERDLDMTKAEFDEAGELAQKALDTEAAVEAAGVDAQVSVKDGTINVHTATPDANAKVTGKKLSKELGVNVELSVKSNDIQRKYASSLDMLAADYLASASNEDLAELQSIGWNGQEFIIHTGALSTEKPSPQRRNADISSTISVTDFASRYANVSVEKADGPAVASAEDVVNGQGYAHEIGDGSTALCSIGWSGFNATGDPAVISAGHCTHDGAYDDVVLTDPEADQAGGTVGLGSDLGTFGFSQFGGENNSPVTGYDDGDSTNEIGNFGTDVSVIDDINPDLDLLPQVTDWRDVADLTSSGPKVTGVSTAVLGAEICKSGRTGWKCGEVDEITLFLVAGIDYGNNANDVRGVKGFASYGALNEPGDSGGAVISGTAAVGITSAASFDGTVAYSADLKDALAHTDDYTVELAVNTPALGSPQDNGEIITGAAVTGTVSGELAPASSVVVTVDGTSTTVPVEDGKWSFNAPSTPGEFIVTVQGKNGFSTSATETYTLTAILAAPVISTPKDSSSMTSFIASISGSGNPGATVALTGDVTGETKVAKDGTWTYEPDEALRYGQYTVKAIQSLDGASSTSASSSFKVVPAKPVITSPGNGQDFSYEEGGPAAIAGTGINGARVLVTINDEIKIEGDVVDGAWRVDVPGTFDTGTHTIDATQTVSEMTSGTATTSVTVLPAPVPAPEPTEPPTKPSPEPTNTPTPAAARGNDSTPVANDNGGDDAPVSNELPKTGSSNVMMSIGAAGGVLLLAGSAFMLFRRRGLEG
ncbi:LPXTG cell wall anchor domain-containing protein [Arthrobacter roseus]|uniref:LPXTG cell wall anchor domain-containing protein n=1 Tax=Arthrobacter roseus TaxID=136274 RepID=UPI001965491B|nr:LPXTG cell wall anchor domain-containing protein [Arthrobacter roseus]MBM7849500.1 LPXTG-motif cell wall-anchored protein [Arthrobacter roseus]